MRRVTKDELTRCTGRNGSPALFAYAGKVYDASASFHWQGGRHWVVHAAGSDLTGCLDQAPHGADLLERLTVVGILEEG